jgi:hypothetical protein
MLKVIAIVKLVVVEESGKQLRFSHRGRRNKRPGFRTSPDQTQL